MAGMLSADELTAELAAHGLSFLVGVEPPRAIPRLSPAELLAALAQQTDARLRAALIALLLARPSLADAAPAALALLAGDARSALMLYYTAAAILQEKYVARLRPSTPQWRPLPDLFSAALGVAPDVDADTRLQQIGRLHRQVTGLAANWVGTYEFAAQRLLRRRKKEALWGSSPSMSLFPIPVEAASRHQSVGRFGLIEVFVYDPSTIVNLHCPHTLINQFGSKP